MIKSIYLLSFSTFKFGETARPRATSFGTKTCLTLRKLALLSLTLSALLILAGCGGLAADRQGEEAPSAEAARPESEVEVVEAETPVEEPASERVAETEMVVEESEPEPEAVVEESEPDMAGDEVMAAQNQAAATAEATAGAETEEEVTDEALTSTEPVADETVEPDMAEAEAMPEAQATEQPVADTAPSPEQQTLLDELTVLGQPPELNNEVWLNSEPLKLADLQGQVVIVEFWTFG